jgi:hypothetical protein
MGVERDDPSLTLGTGREQGPDDSRISTGNGFGALHGDEIAVRPHPAGAT